MAASSAWKITSKLLDQAQVRARLLGGFLRSLPQCTKPDIQPLVKSHFGRRLSPNEFFGFGPSTPLYLGTAFWGGLGWGVGEGGGSKLSRPIATTVHGSGPRSWRTFFFYMEPGFWVLSPGFKGRPLDGAPPVRTQLFSGRHGLAEKSRFLSDLQQPPGGLGLLLGDHLVTMRVRVDNHAQAWARVSLRSLKIYFAKDRL